MTLSYGHEHEEVIGENGAIKIVRSPAIVFHAISMTLIIFIGLPFGYYHIIRKNYFKHKIIQLINLMLIECIGLYATLTFSDHKSYHAILGELIISLLLSIQIIVPLLRYLPFLGSKHAMNNKSFYYNIHYYLGNSLLILILPTQWIFGIEHIVMNGPQDLHTFYGHYFPGISLMIGGIWCIWNRKTKIDTIFNFEIFGLMLPQIIEIIGELVTIDISKIDQNYRVWDHLILDSFMIFCGIFCFIYKKLNLSNRLLLHRMTVGLAAFIFGYVMFSHQHGPNITSKLHKSSGQLAVLMGIIRMYSNSPKFYMLFGILLVVVGIMFNFSNPQTCSYWQNKLYYPEMPYLIISFFIGIYVALINVIISQVYIELNENKQKGETYTEPKSETKKDVDTVQESEQQCTTIPMEMEEVPLL